MTLVRKARAIPASKLLCVDVVGCAAFDIETVECLCTASPGVCHDSSDDLSRRTCYCCLLS